MTDTSQAISQHIQNSFVALSFENILLKLENQTKVYLTHCQTTKF